MALARRLFGQIVPSYKHGNEKVVSPVTIVLFQPRKNSSVILLLYLFRKYQNMVSWQVCS